MTSSGGLAFTFAATRGAFTLRGTLNVPNGTLVVVGPNGSGKSTSLLATLGALDSVTGRLVVDGVVLFDSESGTRTPLEARGMGYMPQNYALWPHMSALGNVEFALRSAKSAIRRVDAAERARAALASVGAEQLSRRRVTQLSGGERQLVALARALVVEPRVLLLDEPLAALDLRVRREMRDSLQRLLGALEIPTIVATHDIDDARAFGSRVSVIEAGMISAPFSLDDRSGAPDTAFVQQLFGALQPLPSVGDQASRSAGKVVEVL